MQTKTVTTPPTSDMALGSSGTRMTLRLPPWRSIRAPIAVGALALVLVAGAAIAARVWLPGFVILGLAIVALAAVASLAWPRAVILVVLLAPVLDRYVVTGLLPSNLAPLAHLLSEGLLVGVGGLLALRAWRTGTLPRALRHPTTLALGAFVALGLVSALVNDVPPGVVVLGLVFTLDAAALFFYPRLVGYSRDQALASAGVIVGLVVVASAIAVAQALLSPTLLGLTPRAGRFGEVYRLASIFDDPNVFGAFIVAAIPFLFIAAARLPTRNLRWTAIGASFLLALALWFTFSRGSWLALLLGVGVTLLLVDRRALLIGATVCVVSFGTAVVMPRDLIVPPPASGEPAPSRQPELIDSTFDRVDTIGAGRDLRTLFVINAMPILADHPLLGVGPGRYGGAVAKTNPTPIYEQYGTDELFWNPEQRTVDNFWLHLLVEAGVLGFAAFLAAALVPGIRILRRAASAVGWDRVLYGGIAAAAVGVAVSSVSTMLLEANSVGFLFWFLLGIGSIGIAGGSRWSRTEADETT